MSDDTPACYRCDAPAIGLYEGVVRGNETIRKPACLEHAPDFDPIEWFDVNPEEAIRWLGDALHDAQSILEGEADELEARDDVDAHMQDVIDGLRHRAAECEDILDAYYRPHMEGESA